MSELIYSDTLSVHYTPYPVSFDMREPPYPQYVGFCRAWTKDQCFGPLQVTWYKHHLSGLLFYGDIETTTGPVEQRWFLDNYTLKALKERYGDIHESTSAC